MGNIPGIAGLVAVVVPYGSHRPIVEFREAWINDSTCTEAESVTRPRKLTDEERHQVLASSHGG